MGRNDLPGKTRGHPRAIKPQNYYLLSVIPSPDGPSANFIKVNQRTKCFIAHKPITGIRP